MANRKGAGRGTGRGYRNLRRFPRDSSIHSQSARGRKQPQRLPGSLSQGKLRTSWDNLSQDERDYFSRIHNVTNPAEYEKYLKQFGLKVKISTKKPIGFRVSDIGKGGKEFNIKIDKHWIEATLVNDESSTDEELVEHFMVEGGSSKKEAEFYVSQRNEALANPLSFRLKTKSEMPEKENSSFSAQTVLQQLGGNKFIAMTGAKGFNKGEDWMAFRIPKSKENINYVKITLTPMDTYDMEFGSIRKSDYTIKKEVKGVYYDQLQEIFTNTTGLETHL